MTFCKLYNYKILYSSRIHDKFALRFPLDFPIWPNSSQRVVQNIPSKSPGGKSSFQSVFGHRNPSNVKITGSNSIPKTPVVKKFRRCIYLNSPITCDDIPGKSFQTIPILVNNQLEALVQSVLEVLHQVNPEKMSRIRDTANDPAKIRKMLLTPKIQIFIESLNDQPLISSPQSFVVSKATAIHAIESRYEEKLENDLVALTLELPPTPSIEHLVGQIRKKIFLHPKIAVREVFSLIVYTSSVLCIENILVVFILNVWLCLHNNKIIWKSTLLSYVFNK